MKTLIKIFFLSCLLSLFVIHSNAQFYNLGQDPSSYKWRQIKTEKFRLVYPENFELQARRMMNILESSAPKVELSLKHKTRQIPFVVHNGQITPNAFAIWAPRRIELFTTPPQNCYSQNWLEQLVIHEYRHAVQMDRTNVGLTRILSYFLGEMAPSAVTGLFVPMWFMEGDAVCAETALSHSGRGRLPSFEMELRAQVLEKGFYSYDKAVMGSYKDFVPDHYVLGYHLVANTRKHYSAEVWSDALDFTGSLPVFINPFNQALKAKTGMKRKKLYQRTMNELKEQWTEQLNKTPLTPFKLITPQVKEHYTRYKYPHYLNDSVIVAERVSYDDISRFVSIDKKGNEKVIVTPGFFSADIFSVNSSFANKPGSLTVDNLSMQGSFMVWTEKIADPRWQNRNYSVIKLHDFTKKETVTLTGKSRYFAPAISNDGNRILAVDIDEANNASLVILSRDSANLKETIVSAGFGEHIMTPAWSEDGKEIVYVLLNGQGKQIKIFNFENKTDRTAFGPVYDEIAEPVFVGKYILFTASFSGIDNIYALDVTTAAVMQVTSSKYGSAHAEVSYDQKKLLYSEYTANGYKIAETDLAPELWKPLPSVEDHSPKLYQHLLKDEKDNIVDETTIPDVQYESKRYHKLSHLLKVHSWAPVYFNYLTGEMKPGISVMSQNDLSTATTVFGYDWDLAQPTGRSRLTFLYSGWYPVFSADFSFGSRTFFDINETEDTMRITRSERAVSAQAHVPLLFQQNEYYSQIIAGAAWKYFNASNYNIVDPDYFSGNINIMELFFRGARFRKQAIRDVYPRFGFISDFRYQRIPFSSSGAGSVIRLQLTGYLPGFMKNHGFKIAYGVQDMKQSKRYELLNMIGYPRGIILDNGFSGSVLNLTYKAPLCYPDLALGSILYMKSLKAALFLDNSIQNSENDYKWNNSYGAEITSEVHLLRFLFPFELGVRVGKSSQNNIFAELIFDVNLSL